MKLPSLKKVLVSLPALALVPLATAGIGLASIQSKTIMTTNGLCVNGGNPSTLADGTTACGAAVYGPNGFTGTITYSADEVGTAAQLVDYICAHVPAGAAFESFGGPYTLTVRAGGTVGSGAVLGTSAEAVTGHVDCVDAANPVSSGSVNFTVPAGGVINYSVLIDGITSASCQSAFSAFNSIRNQAFDKLDSSHAASPSVAPCGPPTIIPEVPFAALLLLTSAAGAVWFVARKQGFRLSLTRSAAS